MGKALKGIGTAIVIGGLVLATAGAAIIPAAAGGGLAGAMGTAVGFGGFSVTASTAIQAGSLIASIGTALTAKKAGASSGYSTEWMADPDQPIPFAFGRVGVSGLIVHKDEYGGHGAYYSVLSVVSGAGPIKSFGTFKADQKTVTFGGAGGMASTSEWRDYMWRGTRLGAQPDTALLAPAGIDGTLPQWGSAYKASGKAVYMLTMAQNSKLDKYPDGEPQVMQEVDGLFYWDPRLDSTHPGGFGPCRLDTPSTWVWGQNGALFALKWALGLWEDPVGKGAPGVGTCVGGMGASLNGIDVTAFLSAANVADANNWKCAAWPNTKEDKRTVFERLLQSAGAVPSRNAGLISCLTRGAVSPSLLTVTAADTAGAIELDAAMPRLDRFNEVTPRFWDPGSNWEMAPASAVKVPAYVTEDGGRRPRGIDYPYVPDAVQAGQLAAYDIVDSREGISGTIPFKTHMRRIKPGDCFTLDEPGFVLDGQKVKAWGRSIDPQTGVVRIRFRSETDAKHAFAMGETSTPPVGPALTPVDPTYVAPPSPDEWSFNGDTFVDNGLSIPAIVFFGDVDNTTAHGVLFEYRPETSPDWSMAGEEGPLVERKEITSVTPGTRYYGAVRYRRGLVFSERLILGPATAGIFSLEAQPYARDLAKGGFASTTDMPKSTAVIYSTPNGTGQLRVTYPATGTSAYFGWNVGRPGAKAYVIRARVRAAADPITAAHWDGRLTYATAALAHSLTAGRMASLAFPGDITAGKWRVLEWEADDLTDYLTSTIDALRFYLLKPGAPPIDIDWLEVGYREGATANTGKLADQDVVDFDVDVSGANKPIAGAGKVYDDAATVNQPPSYYIALLSGRGVRQELKVPSALGNARLGDAFSVVTTEVYSTAISNPPVQTMRGSGGTYRRVANTETSWRGWTKAFGEDIKPAFNGDLLTSAGATATDGAYQTGLGTSAYVDNQGKLATQDAVDFDVDVSGPNKPAAGAGKVFDAETTVNQPPSYYITLLNGRGVRQELKVPSSLGNSRLGDAYSVVTTEVYSTSISNAPVQTMRGKSGTYRRVANTTSSWLGWTKVFGEDIKPAFNGDLLTGGGAVASDAAYQTGLGTSKFIENQGPAATGSDADYKTANGYASGTHGDPLDGSSSSNQPPSFYRARGNRIHSERKAAAIVGGSGAEYGILTTEVSDNRTDRFIHQRFDFSDLIYTRRSTTGDGSWTPWGRSYSQISKPTFGDGLPRNSGRGASTSILPAYPVSNTSGAASTSFTVATSTVTFGDGTTMTLPSGTIPGLTADRNYWVFRRLDNSTYYATSSSSIAADRAADDNYLFVQTQKTATNSGGTVSPPPPLPPGAGGTCPDVDTLILMADGSEKRAGDLAVGDLVHTRREDTDEWGDFSVLAVEIAEQPATRLIMEHAPDLVVTPDHRVFVVGQGWIRAKNLLAGMVVDGRAQARVMGREYAGRRRVVKITVEVAHTYVSAGLLSHNIKWDSGI